VNHLSEQLAAVGNWDDALAANEQAIELYRRLAARSPAAYAEDLTGALNWRSTLLAGAGCQEADVDRE
jgi:hypothetical protein